jgi:hypothetical protein
VLPYRLVKTKGTPGDDNDSLSLTCATNDKPHLLFHNVLLVPDKPL